MKILLCDDHTLFREGLSHILVELDANTTIDLIQAESIAKALDKIKLYSDIDLILLDLNMPGVNGFEGLTLIIESNPVLPVVIISASEDIQDIRQALTNGAMGYICKSASSENMLNALRLVLSGEIYIPPAALSQTAHSIFNQLTPRQFDVLHLMDKGCANKLIASELNISEATVKMHVSAIFRELDVTNRTHAVIKAQSLGLLKMKGTY